MFSTVNAEPMTTRDSSFSLALSACFACIGLHLRKSSCFGDAANK
jgi:hypothetical protein